MQTKRFHNTTPRAVITALVGSVLALSASLPAAHAQHGPSATPVRVKPVRLKELQEHRRITGEIRAVARSRIATIEQGLVLEMPVREGQVVKKGDVLAVLDSRRLDMELGGLEARLKVANAMEEVRKAELELRQSDLDAFEQLHADRASNPKELADARLQVNVATAMLERGKRDVDVVTLMIELIRIRLDDKVIKAPFDGVVVQKHTERGEWVGEGDPIAEVVATGVLRAWMDVPQRYSASMYEPDAMVQVRIDATAFAYPPLKPTIIPLVDPKARTFKLYVELEEKTEWLAPGMSVSGWIPTGSREEYLTVPRDAVLRNAVGFYVYVARGGPNGPVVATPTKVNVLFDVGDEATVQSPALAAGDYVVVEGNERLFPGMPISFPTEPVAHSGGKGAS